MKVLYIVTAFPRTPADVITPWLVETIHRLGDRGVEVEVLAPAYRGLGDQVVAGIRVHRFRYAPRAWETLTHDQTAPDRVREKPRFLGLLPGYVAAGSWAAARLARTGRYDAVHAFWPLPHGLLGLAAKRASGVPLVCTFFGVELTWVERQLRFARPMLRAIVRGSDAVTVISSHTEAAVRRLDPDVVLHRIPFGGTIEVRGEPSRVERRSGVPFRLLFVGRLVERKGVHVLLEAVARLVSSGAPDDLLVAVVGEGPARSALEARSRELGLDGVVEFTGGVPKEELERRFRECDAFVLPAVRDSKGDVEGLGVVLLEALSYGKPVIASASGGIVDIVRPGETGLLVPEGDARALAEAIRTYRTAPELARSHAEAGRALVQREFSWPSIIDRLEAIYRSLGGSKHQEPAS